MSGRDTERKEREWADRLPGEVLGPAEPYENTYRDGSLKNECWRDRDPYGTKTQDKRREHR